MDGIWKLRFPHCMYPVKTTISGLPAVNYPDVCPKEPLSATSAFCEEHCELAKTKGVPTDLRKFLHEYCGVPRGKNKCEKLLYRGVTKYCAVHFLNPTNVSPNIISLK